MRHHNIWQPLALRRWVGQTSPASTMLPRVVIPMAFLCYLEAGKEIVPCDSKTKLIPDRVLPTEGP